MKLIKPGFKIWEQGHSYDDMLKHIEKCGRVCYKSEDSIEEGSALKFVNKLIIRGHGAMLEHGTIYLDDECVETGNQYNEEFYSKLEKYRNNKYSVFKRAYYNGAYHDNVTTNYRVLVENGWLDDLQYICEPTEHHEKRITVKFTCDRGVSHEFVRHRVFSFAQESTRYCNYSKAQFGNEITMITPVWVNSSLVSAFNDGHFTTLSKETLIERSGVSEEEFEAFCTYIGGLAATESCYFRLLDAGWSPQQARSVLPNSLKTELIMTATTKWWKGFFKLRCANSAHPQARELAIPLCETLSLK